MKKRKKVNPELVLMLLRKKYTPIASLLMKEAESLMPVIIIDDLDLIDLIYAPFTKNDRLTLKIFIGVVLYLYQPEKLFGVKQRARPGLLKKLTEVTGQSKWIINEIIDDVIYSRWQSDLDEYSSEVVFISNLTLSELTLLQASSKV